MDHRPSFSKRTLTAGMLESLLLFDHRTLGPLLERWTANTDARPLLDTRAERARFLGGGADGLFSFADHPVNLTRILSRARFAPLPYDPPPVIGIAPVERRAIAGWLTRVGRSGQTPPFAWWDPAVSGLVAFERALGEGPPADWCEWFQGFALVEGVLHGRAAGWCDATFYDGVWDYRADHGAPAQLSGSRSLSSRPANPRSLPGVERGRRSQAHRARRVPTAAAFHCARRRRRRVSRGRGHR